MGKEQVSKWQVGDLHDNTSSRGVLGNQQNTGSFTHKYREEILTLNLFPTFLTTHCCSSSNRDISSVQLAGSLCFAVDGRSLRNVYDLISIFENTHAAIAMMCCLSVLLS
jgi:hypothetical protein